MRAFVLLTLAAVSVAVLVPERPAAQPRNPRVTSIFMTRNHNVGRGRGQFPAECLGSVATETIPALKGDPISWQIKNGNGHNSEHQCSGLDRSQVELVFETDVMGSAVKKRLRGKGNSVDGTVSLSAVEAGRGSHKYQVYYKGVPAGPDPEIIVDCPSCGPEPGGPGQ